MDEGTDPERSAAPQPRPGLRALFAVPAARTALIGYVLARLPVGMTIVALLLAGQRLHGTLAGAGLAGWYTVGVAVGAPLQGKLFDRIGPRLLWRTGVVQAAGLALLGVGVERRAGFAVLAALALLVALTQPPVPAAVRAAWPQLLSAELRPVAFSAEAILLEGIYLLGPLLVGWLTPVEAGLPLYLIAVGSLLGTTLLSIRLPDPTDPTARPLWSWGPLRSAQVRWILMVTGLFAIPMSGESVAVVAAAHGHSRLYGVFVGLQAVGSIIGGVAFTRISARTQRVRFAELFGWMGMFLVLAWIVVAEIGRPTGVGSGIIFGVVLVAASMPVAPLVGLLSQTAGELAPGGMAGETFTWLSTTNMAVQAVAFPVIGEVIEHLGSAAGFAAAGGLALVAVVVCSGSAYRAGTPAAAAAGA